MLILLEFYFCYNSW